MNVTYFPNPSDFRAWLARHHEEADELWVGFYKKGSGLPSITWPESVDEALCFGWIDGIRKRLNETSYVIRFTPRRRRSAWSNVNVRRAHELIASGRMSEAGVEAFRRRNEGGSDRYSYELRGTELDSAFVRLFRSNEAAWAFYEKQPPWYRQTTAHWVMSAKKDETKLRRLGKLIDDSSAGRRIGILNRQLTESSTT